MTALTNIMFMQEYCQQAKFYHEFGSIRHAQIGTDMVGALAVFP